MNWLVQLLCEAQLMTLVLECTLVEVAPQWCTYFSRFDVVAKSDPNYTMTGHKPENLIRLPTARPAFNGRWTSLARSPPGRIGALSMPGEANPVRPYDCCCDLPCILHSRLAYLARLLIQGMRYSGADSAGASSFRYVRV
jgi:hypothetical protein